MLLVGALYLLPVLIFGMHSPLTTNYVNSNRLRLITVFFSHRNSKFLSFYSSFLLFFFLLLLLLFLSMRCIAVHHFWHIFRVLRNEIIPTYLFVLRVFLCVPVNCTFGASGALSSIWKWKSITTFNLIDINWISILYFSILSRWNKTICSANGIRHVDDEQMSIQNRKK